MASTYSASLRLELMATGDQSGTWGVTTNTNLGTLLEQAITGVLSVAEGDTTLTLTTNNGASDQARNAVVILTGAMTADRNVVVQTAQKLYLIKNSTTGGHNVIAKTAAGTGVTIAPNTSQWVYSDGTNVVAGLVGNGAPDANGNISANSFIPGYTTTATAAGTTTLTVTSTYTQYFTGSTTQTVVLPVASTMSQLGQGFEIVNLSTGSLTVNSSGGNLVATVLAGNTVRVEVILLSGTTAASWNVIASSVPNPLSLSGSTVGYTPFQGISTEAAAAAGPIMELYRNSASPAANDVMGQLLFTGQNSTPAKVSFAYRQAVLVSPTASSEVGAMDDYVMVAGTATRVFSVGPNNPNTPNGFIDGYATTATAAGTTTLTVTSAKNQYFTGTTTQTVVLPVTSTLVLGQQFVIYNNSTGRVTVQSSGANTIQVMGGTFITLAAGAPGTKLVATCISLSGTGTASWSYEYIAPVTPWVSWTPTFTGFGTVSSISMWSRRNGDSLEIRGKYTSGTATAVEARVSLGFNGTDGNVSSDSTKVTSIQLCGVGPAQNAVIGGGQLFILIESGVGYVTFANGNVGGNTSLTKLNGNAVVNGTNACSFFASVPITNG